MVQAQFEATTDYAVFKHLYIAGGHIPSEGGDFVVHGNPNTSQVLESNRTHPSHRVR